MGRFPSPRLLRISLVVAAAGLVSFAGLPRLRAQDDSARHTSASQQTASSSNASDAPSGGPVIPETLPKGKKLILTDGSFQLVREYQREGDRVRYYSVERSAWEEIPAALVDWAATQKAEADDQARDKNLSQKIKASELAVRTADIQSDRSFEVRPGLILPDDAGLYVLDGQKISAMEQDQAASHLDKGREAARIATGVPLIPSKHRIDIAGKHATLRIHTDDPEFYFRPVDGREPHLSLLRLEVYGNTRVVESVSTNIADISTYKNHSVPLLSWDAARGLTRFTVEETLEPGEYAIVENRADGEVDLYVWDFGVDASPEGKDAQR